MVNVFFEKYDKSVEKIMKYLIKEMDGVRFIAVENDGFLPDIVESPIKDICKGNGENTAPKHLYDLKVPKLCDVRYDRTIRRFGKTIGKIIVCNEEQAIVGSVERICDKGFVDREVFYDSCGHIFKINLYDEHHEILSTIYKGKSKDEEYIYTPKCDSLVHISKGMVCHSYSWKKYVRDYISDKRKEATTDIYVNWLATDCCENGANVLIVTDNECLMKLNDKSYDDIPYDKILFIEKELCDRFKYKDSEKCRKMYLVDEEFEQSDCKKNILILTNSDQIVNLGEIVDRLNDFKFYIAARTMVSPTLAAFNERDNVSVIQCIDDDTLKTVLRECSFYLDINRYNDVFGVSELAINNHIVIWGFDETLHDADVVANENKYRNDETEKMCHDIRNVSEDMDAFNELLRKQISLVKSINEGALG